MRTWRTLLRVVTIEEDMIGVVIPAWNPYSVVYIDKPELPAFLLNALKELGASRESLRFFARVNLDAPRVSDIKVVDYESLAEVPVDNYL